MKTARMNAQVVDYLKVLEVENLQLIPKMKEVRKKFLRLVKAKHPGGGQGSGEDFIELQDAYEFLMNYIKVNNPEGGIDDEEEQLTRKQNETANIKIVRPCSSERAGRVGWACPALLA